MDLEKIIRFLRSLKKKKGFYQPLFLIIVDAYYVLVLAGANNNTVFKCFVKLYRIF